MIYKPSYDFNLLLYSLKEDFIQHPQATDSVSFMQAKTSDLKCVTFDIQPIK